MKVSGGPTTRPQFVVVALALLGATAASLAASCALPVAVQIPSSSTLRVGEAVEGFLEPGGSATFLVSTPTGQVMIITARHSWFSAKLTVLRSDGTLLEEGENSVVIHSRPPGDYRVRITAPPEAGHRGRFTLRIRESLAAADVSERLESLTTQIRAAGFRLRSIEPDDEDFTDLEPLVAKIGSARIVFLGEQTHNDGATFLAKARLVRFLHARLDFDVLAWECGFVEVSNLDAELRSTLPIDRLPRRLTRNWWASAQIRPVFSYARSTYATSRPLLMAGLDPQFVISASGAEYARSLLDFFDRADPGFITVDEREALVDGLESAMSALNASRFRPAARDSLRASPRRQAALIVKLLARIDLMRARFAAVHGEQLVAFHEQALKNAAALEREIDAMVASGGFASPASNNLRDGMMAANLAWLATERYPTSRIAVWAASFHTLRNPEAVDAGFSGVRTMGAVTNDLMPDDVFSIGFITNAGRIGSPATGEQWDVPPAPPGSLEALLHDLGDQYVMVDLRDARDDGPRWMRHGFLARPLGNLPLWNQWAEGYDAFIFLDVMAPSTPAGDMRPQRDVSHDAR